MMTILKRLSVLFAMCVALAACSSTAGTTAGKYVDDSVITTKVKAAIFNDANLKSMEIGVETYHGTVQLSGFVKNPESIPEAARIARGIEGVKAVKNDLAVKR